MSQKNIDTNPDHFLDFFVESLPPAKYGIARCYNDGMHEIYLAPDLSLTSAFMRHKASVGVLVTHRMRIPVGVESYPWFANKSALVHSTGFKLTALALKTAWVGPFVCRKKTLYQLKQALLVTLVIILVQPLYELGWQFRRMFAKLFF